MSRSAANTLVIDEHHAALRAALERLDVLLQHAARAVPDAYGRHAAGDPYRGLRIRPEDAAHLLAHAPGEPVFHLSGHPSHNGQGPQHDMPPRLRWLADVYNLAPFDCDVILIALAPAIDRRYERLYAYLQDDVTRSRPTVDLALNLLCPTRDARLARLAHFTPGAPLSRHAILHLDSPTPYAALLARDLALDPQITALLLGFDGLDPRLASVGHLETPAGVEPPALADTVDALDSAAVQRDPLLAYLHGPSDHARRDIAAALAARHNMRLLTVDALAAYQSGDNFSDALRLILREAWFQGAVLHIDQVEALADAAPANRATAQLFDALSSARTITLLAGEAPPRFNGQHITRLVTLPVRMPAAAERRTCWRDACRSAGISPGDAALDALAARFRLMPGQIAQAVAAAQGTAATRHTPDAPAVVTADDLFAAARAQTGHDLRELAEHVIPRATWADIVLPPDTLTQLRELCDRVDRREDVLHTWRFADRLSRGTGTSALFSGPSGTGKTMAAEIIAHTLDLALYRVDLSTIVSKYIGETEKNLSRVFDAAQNEVLFFDEADALFGKRSEVRDSHDRYANIEISYLLQKMEAFEGVAILATNFQQNLDVAFMRRFAFAVPFPFPNAASRRQIWQRIWPDAVPLGPAVDLDFMAAQFPISGGSIKNIALAAAFLAHADASPVTMRHLLHATYREYQKIGKVLTAADIAPYANIIPLDDAFEKQPE